MSTQPTPKIPRIPELAGATRGPFQLAGRTEVDLALLELTGPASLDPQALQDYAPPRVFLNFEKMLGKDGSPPYFVYINVPPGNNPEEHPDLFAGDLPMFGLLESSISDATHTPDGLYTQLDVTLLYARLLTLESWNPRKLVITSEPRYPGNLPPVTVGRVSLFFA